MRPLSMREAPRLRVRGALPPAAFTWHVTGAVEGVQWRYRVRWGFLALKGEGRFKDLNHPTRNCTCLLKIHQGQQRSTISPLMKLRSFLFH